MVRACGQDPRPWIESRRRIAAAIARGLDRPIAEPAELPSNLNGLFGRQEAMDRLTRLIELGADMESPVIALAGPAGVGKSALAIQVGHSLRHLFPGGCLYVNMQGNLLGVRPLRELDLAGELLGALGGAADGKPLDAATAGTRLRALLSDRRTLVICDDMCSADQLVPLLPLGRRVTVILTTRTIRAVPERARLLSLRPLSSGAAVELLAQEIGWERAEAEKDQLIKVAHLCDHLPLLLLAAGRRLAARPEWPVGPFVERIADDKQRLHELCITGIDIRARMSASLDLVDPSSLPMFAALCRYKTSEVTLPELASRLGIDERDAMQALEDLSDAHIVQSPEPGKYRVAPAHRMLLEDLGDLATSYGPRLMAKLLSRRSHEERDDFKFRA